MRYYYTHKDYYECPQHSLFAMTKGHPFGRLVVSAGDYLRRRVPEVSVLVFLMSGSIRILRNNAREKEISSGSMILLPKFACPGRGRRADSGKISWGMHGK